MKLVINNDVLIKTLQQEFNRGFPYLKIEFFSKKHKKGEGSQRKDLKKDNSKISDCRKSDNNGIITITGNEKVSEIEKIFQETFGLSVQIFRKSGRVWLETTSTDDWTLKKQNSQAEELRFPVND